MNCNECRYLGVTGRSSSACARIDGRRAASVKAKVLEPGSGAPYERIVTTGSRR